MYQFEPKGLFFALGDFSLTHLVTLLLSYAVVLEDSKFKKCYENFV
jgi:hypothetical protein